ncbi:MAG: hypothetical protein IPH93_04970 [Saprospiraceae bacterium]|nr:hypothetical protein [Saprospiraceae bacterium]
MILAMLGSECSVKDVVAQKQEEIKKLAELFCKAKKLKSERFILADKLNRVEDSINLPNYKILMHAKRDSILKEAEGLTLSTKKLADSIIVIQDQLYLELKPEEKKKIDQAFELELNRTCR